jgi:hypothetical protein
MNGGEALENIIRGLEFSLVCNSPEGCKSASNITTVYSSIIVESCKKFVNDVSFGRNFLKSLRSALNYGYMGKSKGEKNGIIDIRREDIILLRDYEKIMGRHNIPEKYSLSGKLIPVKIVAHIPSGDRFIGCFSNSDSKAVIFGMSNYNRSYL